MKIIFSFLVLVLLYGDALSTLRYLKNEQITYDLSTQTLTKGSEDKEGHTLEVLSTLYLQCVDILPNGHYYMKMNLYDTGFGNPVNDTEDTQVDEFLQSWIYFTQDSNGKVVSIAELPDEDEDFIHLKLNIINSLQTSIANTPGEEFSSTNGIYKPTFSNRRSIETDNLIVSHKYDESHFTAFADPVIPSLISQGGGFKYSGSHEHEIGPDGKFQTVVIYQETKYSGEKDLQEFSADNEEEVTKGHVYGSGNIKMTFIEKKIVAEAENRAILGVAGSLFDLGKAKIKRIITAQNVFDIEGQVKDTLDKLLSLDESSNDFDQTRMHLSQKLIYFLKHNTQLFIDIFVVQIEKKFDEMTLQMKGTIFYILSLLEHSESQKQLIKMGIHAKDENEVVLACMAAREIDSPVEDVLHSLMKVFVSNRNGQDVKNSAILSYGELCHAHRQTTNPTAAAGYSVFDQQLLQMLSDDEMNEASIMALLYAVENAHLKISHDIYVKLNQLKNPLVHELADALFDGVKVQRRMTEDDFPFNNQKSLNKKMGGKYASISIDAGYFVGTNFNCKNTNFNYKGEAHLIGKATIFKHEKTLVDGRILYGKANGKVIGNDMHLKLVGKTIFQKTIPTVQMNCELHKKNLYHNQKVFSVSFHVMVGPVPVNLGVSGDIVLGVDWGWKVCDKDLSALVQIEPSVKLVVTGEAAVSIVLVKGGVHIHVSFNVALIPQAYIHGSLCRMGVGVNLKVVPFTFDFALFYQTRGCSFHRRSLPSPNELPSTGTAAPPAPMSSVQRALSHHHFHIHVHIHIHIHLHCGWKKAHEKSLFHYSYTAENKSLWKKEWVIKK